MTRQIVYLGLGTNLGDRLDNLRRVCKNLPPTVIVLRASSVYQTPPWGFTDQPYFFNQVLEAETSLEPLDLLNYIKNLEVELGRLPSFHYGPRQIDIDILMYADRVVNLPGLVIPHPHLPERAFVLVPLAELAPLYRHPQSGRTMQELLSQVNSANITRVDVDINTAYP